MPAGSSAALICDTGALIDTRRERARPQAVSQRDLLGADPLRPGCARQVDYFLRDERQAMQVFMKDFSRGAFTYAPPTTSQLACAMEVDRQFEDLRLGLVDGSVVAGRVLGHPSAVRRETCVTLPPSDYVTAAPSSWWFVQRVPTTPDLQARSPAWDSGQAAQSALHGQAQARATELSIPAVGCSLEKNGSPAASILGVRAA